MKKFAIFTIILLVFMSFTFYKNSSYYVPENERIVNNLMEIAARDLSSKYNMTSTGVTVGMPSGVVKLLGLEFDVVGPLPKEEIRKILMNSSDDFLALINSDVNIRP